MLQSGTAYCLCLSKPKNRCLADSWEVWPVYLENRSTRQCYRQQTLGVSIPHDTNLVHYRWDRHHKDGSDWYVLPPERSTKNWRLLHISRRKRKQIPQGKRYFQSMKSPQGLAAHEQKLNAWSTTEWIQGVAVTCDGAACSMARIHRSDLKVLHVLKLSCVFQKLTSSAIV